MLLPTLYPAPMPQDQCPSHSLFPLSPWLPSRGDDFLLAFPELTPFVSTLSPSRSEETHPSLSTTPQALFRFGIAVHLLPLSFSPLSHKDSRRSLSLIDFGAAIPIEGLAYFFPGVILSPPRFLRIPLSFTTFPLVDLTLPLARLDSLYFTLIG